MMKGRDVRIIWIDVVIRLRTGLWPRCWRVDAIDVGGDALAGLWRTHSPYKHPAHICDVDAAPPRHDSRGGVLVGIFLDLLHCCV